MNFGQALEKAKAGQRISRDGWNGKGMYVRLVRPYSDPAYRITESEHADGTLARYLGMKTADNKFVPWLASQTDILADDWGVCS
jgi:hypothetical protein